MNRRVVALTAAALVVIGAVVVAVRVGDDDDHPSAAPSTTSPTSSPTDAVTTLPAVTPTTGRAVVDGQVRSAEATARVGGIRGMRLRRGSFTVTGRVAGQGNGTLYASGEPVLLLGTLDLEVDRLVLQPASAVLGDTTVHASVLEIGAPSLSFTPEGNRQAHALQGTVRIELANPQLGGHLTGRTGWDDAPPQLLLSGPGRVSWAGGGSIRVGDGAPLTGGFLGLAGPELGVTVTRKAGGMTVTGAAAATQVYVDGTPRLATSAKVDLISASVTVKAGNKGNFVWAPRNRGALHDMAMTRIRAGNDQGRWVNVALQTLPRMFGGEPHADVGGDTRDLGKRGSGVPVFGGRAAAIASVTGPGGADRRDITYNVPAGTPPGTYTIELVVDGNFDPVTVAVPVRVT